MGTTADAGATTKREADVCVVGAGLAGLTAARRLSPGRPVGGRARGAGPGRWPGVDPDQPQRGARRHGGLLRRPRTTTACTRWPRRWAWPRSRPSSTGDNVLATGGKVRRYRGDIPRISPVALLSAAQAIARMNAMAKKVPVDAPWDAPKAAEWDAMSVRAWLTAAHVPTRLARDLMEATVRACFAADLSEVSLLNWLFLVRSAGRDRVADEHRRRLPGLPVRGRRGPGPRRHGGRARRRRRARVAGDGRAPAPDDRVEVSGAARHGDGPAGRAGPPACAGRRHPLRPRPAGGPRPAHPPGAGRHGGQDGRRLRRALLAPRRGVRRHGGHRRRHRGHARHVPARPPPRASWPGTAAGPRARALAALRRAERRDVFVRMLTTRLGPGAASPVRGARAELGAGAVDALAAPWATSPPAC